MHIPFIILQYFSFYGKGLQVDDRKLASETRLKGLRQTVYNNHLTQIKSAT